LVSVARLEVVDWSMGRGISKAQIVNVRIGSGVLPGSFASDYVCQPVI